MLAYIYVRVYLRAFYVLYFFSYIYNGVIRFGLELTMCEEKAELIRQE